MKTDWAIKYEDTESEDSIEITFGQVIIRSIFEGGRTMFEQTCSHKEFLDGKFQDEIKNKFGEGVLKEIIESIKMAPSHPPFQEIKEKYLTRKFFIESIPENKLLKNLISNEKTVNGYNDHKIAEISKYGVRTYFIKSDNLTLFYGGAEDYLLDNKGTRIDLRMENLIQAVVELNDYFYIVYYNNFAVISPTGDILFNTFSYKLDEKKPLDPMNHLFDFKFSIINVYRHGEIIFFHYLWDKNFYKPGLVQYDLKRGLIGHCEIE